MSRRALLLLNPAARNEADALDGAMTRLGALDVGLAGAPVEDAARFADALRAAASMADP